ncbi:MAG TPA: type II toxin-antitoxin system RelE/ParE family toxin [Xanthobacteraceae bacterium]|nr:type II toxin-antitoxin system RelE/ParE family toxin [Xanthobacteraceae bacterium]
MKLVLLPSADADIVRQFGWYVEHGLPDVARRFRSSVESSIKLALSRPKAGAPKPVRNSVLGDLRSWPVKGFDEFRIYYLARQDTLTVVRVLHDKRDIGAILEKQAIDDPGVD